MREVRHIVWVDSSGSSDATWTPLAEVLALELHTCQSVGFVVRETDELVTIVQSLDDQRADQHVDHFLTIPRFAITKQTTLRKARP